MRSRRVDDRACSQTEHQCTPSVERSQPGFLASICVMLPRIEDQRQNTSMEKETKTVSSRCWFTHEFQFGMDHFRYLADDFNCLPHTQGVPTVICSIAHGLDCS